MVSYVAIIVSNPIPADKKDAVVGHLTEAIAAIKAAPGVKNVYAGPVVGEDEKELVDIIKIVQLIEFESLAAADGLKSGNYLDAVKGKFGDFPPPASVDLYEAESFPTPADLKFATVISRLRLNDVSQKDAAKADLAALVAEQNEIGFGGKSLTNEGEGLFIIGFESKEAILAAAKDPKAAKGKALWEKYGTQSAIVANLKSSA